VYLVKKKILFLVLLLFFLLVLTSCEQNIAGEAIQGQQCQSNDDCNLIDPICRHGFCGACFEDAECPHDFICNVGSECEWLGVQCGEDDDCDPDQSCTEGICLGDTGKICVADYQCNNGLSCETLSRSGIKICVPECQDSDGGVNLRQKGQVTNARDYLGKVYENEAELGEIGVNEDTCDIEQIRDLDDEGNIILLGENHIQYEYSCGERDQLESDIIFCRESGRRVCAVEGELCADTELALEHQACEWDFNCQLGLLCEQNVCRRISIPNHPLPEKISQACQVDNDCSDFQFQPPEVVCDDNICRGGIGTDCRYGCSLDYRCWNDAGLCGPTDTAHNLPVGSACSSAQTCASEICINTEQPWGICEENLRGFNEVCYERSDCSSDRCENNKCLASEEYEYCNVDRDCMPGLSCQYGICVEENVQETRLDQAGCEDFRELVPGYNQNNDNQINLVFIGVEIPGDVDLREALIKYVDFPGFSDKTTLFSTNPFNTNRELFNLWFVNEIQEADPLPDEDRKKWCVKLCNNAQKKTTACQLDNKINNNICALACRGTTWSGVTYSPVEVKNGTFSRSSTLTHELGHAFGKLTDEYVENFGTNTRFPNCAQNELTANLWWGDLIGQGENDFEVGYYPGCGSKIENIKPTQKSVMSGNGNSFGAVSERHICYKIAVATGEVDETCAQILLVAAQEDEKTREKYKVAGRAITGAVIGIAPGGDDFPDPEIDICNNDGVCNELETVNNCPNDCEEPELDLPQAPREYYKAPVEQATFMDSLQKVATQNVFTINLAKKGKVYLISDFEVKEELYIYLLEDPTGDGNIHVDLVRGEINIPFHTKTPFIVEEFYDDIPEGEKSIKLIEYVEQDLDEISIRVPLENLKQEDIETIMVNLPNQNLELILECNHGQCQPLR
jgi:hypothetical protein